MKITLNGTKKEFAHPKNLESVIDEVVPKNRRIVAEVNGEIIKTPCWNKTEIKNGDTVELVTFVGGG